MANNIQGVELYTAHPAYKVNNSVLTRHLVRRQQALVREEEPPGLFFGKGDSFHNYYYRETTHTLNSIQSMYIHQFIDTA